MSGSIHPSLSATGTANRPLGENLSQNRVVFVLIDVVYTDMSRNVSSADVRLRLGVRTVEDCRVAGICVVGLDRTDIRSPGSCGRGRGASFRFCV
jgi:hypothetical protein